METRDLTIPGIVFIVLIVGTNLGLKLSAGWSVVIGFVGFGIVYFLMNRK